MRINDTGNIRQVLFWLPPVRGDTKLQESSFARVIDGLFSSSPIAVETEESNVEAVLPKNLIRFI